MTELEKAAINHRGELNSYLWTSAQDCTVENAKEAFIAGAQWQAKQSPWITVADREPDEFKNVLLSAGSCPSVFVGHYNGEDFVVASTGEIVEYFRVLHWMPIPE